MKAGNPIRLHITASCTVAGSVSAADRGLRHTLCDRCLPKNNRTMRGCKTADNANEKSVSWLNAWSSILPVPSGTYYFSKPLFLHSRRTLDSLSPTWDTWKRGIAWALLPTGEWSLTGSGHRAESCRIGTIKAPIKKSLTVGYSRRIPSPDLFRSPKTSTAGRKQFSATDEFIFQMRKTGEESNSFPSWYPTTRDQKNLSGAGVWEYQCMEWNRAWLI